MLSPILPLPSDNKNNTRCRNGQLQISEGTMPYTPVHSHGVTDLEEDLVGHGKIFSNIPFTYHKKKNIKMVEYGKIRFLISPSCSFFHY